MYMYMCVCMYISNLLCSQLWFSFPKWNSYKAFPCSMVFKGFLCLWSPNSLSWILESVVWTQPTSHHSFHIVFTTERWSYLPSARLAANMHLRLGKLRGPSLPCHIQSFSFFKAHCPPLFPGGLAWCLKLEVVSHFYLHLSYCIYISFNLTLKPFCSWKLFS